MKISNLIFLSFLFILLLFSITTYINFKQSEAIKNNAEYISVSSQVMKNTSRFQRNILNMVSGLRGYMLTGGNYFIDAYDSSALENEIIIQELLTLIPDSSKQKTDLIEIKRLNDRWVDNYAFPLRQAKALAIQHDSNKRKFESLYTETFLSGEEREIQNQLQHKFREFTNNEYAEREVRKELLAKSVQRTGKISLYLTILSICVSLIIVSFLAHRISSRIVNMVKLANEISAGNYAAHIPESGKDELSTLSKVLNHMAEVLSENISLLKQKNEELDQFAHIVSHDLKGPLRGIGNVVTWIEEDHAKEISPKVNEYLQIIKGRVSRGENLIEGILSYARIDRDKMHSERVNVNELINEILENVIDTKGLTIQVQKNMPVLYTEKIQLFQVFSNLISNAVKYHDKPDGFIKVYYTSNDTKYHFFVEDNGPGISQTYHNKIFVIFQTLTERDSFESTGVGLAIVKKILDARKETIKIDSEPGKGSTFSFTWSKNNK